ncbi:MAG TPA: M23 family metallopeptidase [Bryobacteraceae bacterium]|nr:M23 family metallopeptidase [Bryobacteraceae bacterium]
MSSYAGQVRALLVPLLAWHLSAQSFRIEPSAVKQGRVVRVYGNTRACKASLDHREIRLFAQENGGVMGLMPVGVLTRPGVYELQWMDQSGATIHNEQVVIGNAHYARQNVVMPKSIAQLHSTPDERDTVSTFLKEVSPVRYWTEPFETPIPGCVTSPFGVTRLNNGKLTGDFHAGLDQRGPFGSPIHAVTDGVVKVVQQFSLHGGTVAIDHGQGLESMYLHMSKFKAKEGQAVKKGDVIGYVGSTGRSTGPHLHWALYVYGEPVSPLQWVHLKPCAGESTKVRHARGG